MSHRRGVTLTEVLMAIFVMGIGMISLLVLFPVGIFSMQQSIQDNRTGTVATNAAALAETLSLRRDDWVVGDPRSVLTAANVPGSMYWQLSLALPFGFAGTPQNSWTVYQFYPNGPSLPVLIDPVGIYAFENPVNPRPLGYRVFPGNQVNFGVTRSHVSHINPFVAQTIPRRELFQRWFSQPDDFSMDEFGQAQLTVNTANLALNGLVERDLTYSWAYVWRRPRFHDPETVDLSIVIFKSRKLVELANINSPEPAEQTYLGPSIGGGPLGSEPVFRPFSPFLAAAGQPQRPQTAIIAWDPNQQSQPAVKRGDWVFDATTMLGLAPAAGIPQPFQLPPGFVVPPEFPPPYFNGYFYKVVGVSEPLQIAGNEYHLHLELDRPVRNVGFAAVFVPGVVEVIEKSDGLKTQATVGP